MAPVPDPELSEVIESYSARFRDPVQRLRFLRACAQVVEDTPPLLGRLRMGRWGYRLIVLDSLSRTYGFDRGAIPWTDRFFLLFYRVWQGTARYVPLTAAGLGILLLVAVGVSFFSPREVSEAAPDEIANLRGGPLAAAAHAAPGDRSANGSGPLDVWLVEANEEGELYSNGLRVLDDYLTHSEPRAYPVFSRSPEGLPVSPQWRDQPAGIVYHTTVSDFAPPLERENNQLIRYRGQQLMRYIAREKLYNIVIDRFGRVYRTVPEAEITFHAGYSIWTDGGELYFNLNPSFISVAFETRPEALDPNAAPQEAITPAQINSARLLTQALRERFGIVADNCVTHEMVSVSPNQMLIGYHTDWKGRFPFVAVGLPDNYQKPLPSIVDWGFQHDAAFAKELNGRLWPGIRTSGREFDREAKARNLPVDRYRERLRKRYHEFLVELSDLTPPAQPEGRL